MSARKRRSAAESARTADYEIQISGTMHERWSRWFGDVVIMIKRQEDCPPITVFHCSAMDQARLRGVLNTIWDLNLDLVSVQRLSSGATPPGLQTDEAWAGMTMEDNDV